MTSSDCEWQLSLRTTELDLAVTKGRKDLLCEFESWNTFFKNADFSQSKQLDKRPDHGFDWLEVEQCTDLHL